MTINNYTFNHLWLQLERHRNLYPRLVVVVLGIYLLNYAAVLTWRMVPTAESTAAVSSHNTLIKANNARANIKQIQNLYLFGHPEQQTEGPKVVAAEDAPETNLNLTLTGAVASTEKGGGAAIVENRGQQNTYGIGDIIDGTRATIDKVFADRIIIKNGGQSETLMLDGIDFQKGGNGNNLRGVAKPQNAVRNNSTQRKSLSPAVQEAREQLSQKPASFADYISISPETKNGESIGYRVQPGKKPALFNAAGLENNDIITELNGLDLTDPQQAMEAMSSLQSEQTLQITVNRNDELLTLYLDLPDNNDEF
ncbi:type II secretion system protein GspC [Alteromonadaceae bacterium BrNp21-10]|nr:type II secretion system protein GspC [Alteromonadaceae bacterium BrNp21-10]